MSDVSQQSWRPRRVHLTTGADSTGLDSTVLSTTFDEETSQRPGFEHKSSEQALHMTIPGPEISFKQERFS
jgi:hypothetical protein